MSKLKDSGVPWLGAIPSHWSSVRGKYILRYEQKPTRETDEVITCFRDGEVTLRRNRREEGFTIATKEHGYQGIDVGDLIVHGMDGFAGAIGISDSRGKASPVLNVLATEQHKRYLMYYMRGLAYADVFLAMATGIRVRSCDLRWNKIAELIFTISPTPEQQRIADYLDTRCEELDKLRDDIQSQIETLEQYKKSVITEAVTKGLDSTVEMKVSGIPWVGNIPTGWNVHRLAVYFSERKHKNALGKEDNRLSLSYGKVVSKDINSSDGLLPESFNTYNIVEADDIIIRPTDLQNDKRSLRTGLVKEHGIITSAYIALAPKAEINVAYYHYLLHAYDVSKVFYNMGNGVRQGLNYSEFSKLLLLEPPLSEQHRIAEYLDTRCAEIDAIIDTKKEQLTTLAEYRKSLIYEYVTGKKEVPA